MITTGARNPKVNNFKDWLNESHRGDIARLSPNSVITVFHGTSYDDAYNFCLNGIDGKKTQKYRIYPHISGGKPIKFGLFVAPDLKTAQKFGNVILKFKAIGKDLIHRFPVEMKRHDKGYYKEIYPKSSRPSVSADMLDKGVEPQAIFTGLVSPRAILKVYAYSHKDYKWTPMSPEEYIKNYQEKNPNTRIYKSTFEPQEYKMSLEDFVKRSAKEHNSTEEEILDTLKDIYKRYGYLTGIGNVPHSLLRRIERQLATLNSKDN